MSIETIPIIIDRVSLATKQSPIAVFRVRNTGKDRVFNVLFASTVLTKQMIGSNHKKLVGVFDRTMNEKYIELALEYEVEKVVKSTANYQLKKIKQKQQLE